MSEERPFCYYFGYGSNLLSNRMKLKNKTAMKVGIGILQDYKLTFSGQSSLWKGSTANIVPAKGSTVIGVVWKVFDTNILDKQELHYDPINVQVTLTRPESGSTTCDNHSTTCDNHSADSVSENTVPQNGQVLICRVYVQREDHQSLKKQGTPSRGYKNVILKGMKENSFPKDYIASLINTPDNGVIPEEMAQLVPECLDWYILVVLDWCILIVLDWCILVVLDWCIPMIVLWCNSLFTNGIYLNGMFLD